MINFMIMADFDFKKKAYGARRTTHKTSASGEILFDTIVTPLVSPCTMVTLQ
jgi:hypothetical protein